MLQTQYKTDGRTEKKKGYKTQWAKNNEGNKWQKAGITNNNQKGVLPTIRENTNWPKFCIFCETNTHNTAFCAIKQYTSQYKEERCRKHNACYNCFETTEHKAEACPKKLKCFLCPKNRHFNMHPRDKIIEYYKSRKQRKPQKDKM